MFCDKMAVLGTVSPSDLQQRTSPIIPHHRASPTVPPVSTRGTAAALVQSLPARSLLLMKHFQDCNYAVTLFRASPPLSLSLSPSLPTTLPFYMSVCLCLFLLSSLSVFLSLSVSVSQYLSLSISLSVSPLCACACICTLCLKGSEGTLQYRFLLCSLESFMNLELDC